MSLSRRIFASAVFIVLNCVQPGVAMSVEKNNASEHANAVDLEKIVVTPSRQETYLSNSSSKVTVISKEQIKGVGAQTLDEVFKYIPNIVTTGNSLYQGTPQVMMRGVPDQGRTIVMIDGVPLNSAWQGGVEWAMLPVAAIERVELVYGPMSTQYGSGAMGGVINVITTRQTETVLRSTYGSLDTRSTSFLQGGGFGKFSYNIGGSGMKTGGYVPDVRPQSYSVRRTYEDWNSFVKLSYLLDDRSDISLGFLHNDKTACRGREYFNIRDKANMGYVTYDRSEGDVTLKNTFFINDQNWGREFDTSPAYNYVNMTEKIDTTDLGNLTTLGVTLREAHQLTVGLDYKLGLIHLNDQYQRKTRRAESNGQQTLAALFVQDEIGFLEERLIFTTGLRGDYARSDRGWSSDTGQTGPLVSAFSRNYEDKDWVALSPKASLVYHATEKTSFRTSMGRAFHAPFLKDLYVVTTRPAKTVNNNPDLKPETLNSYEVGMSHGFSDSLDGDLSFYYSQGNDFISTRTLSASTSMADNIDTVRMYGMETGLKYRLSKHWQCSTGHVFNISRIGKDSVNSNLNGNDLALQPRQQVNARIVYEDPKTFTISTGVRYVGSMYADNENIERLKNYYLCDALISKKIGSNIELSLTLDNLFDNKYDIPKESSEVLVSSGRMVTVSVMMKW